MQGDNGGFKARITRSSALSRDLHHVKRLAPCHEQPVALWAAEAEIGAYFGQPNASDQLAL
jgi:hypothetical protein